MIRDRDCPRCYGPMTYDMGPAMDPDPEYGVVIEAVYRCTVCGREEVVHQHTWSETEIAERVAAVKQMSGTPDLDERAKVLAERGYEAGKRWWP